MINRIPSPNLSASNFHRKNETNDPKKSNNSPILIAWLIYMVPLTSNHPKMIASTFSLGRQVTLFNLQLMNTPILYIKSGCPWCVEAEAYFKANQVQVETREVRSNKVFMDQMVKLSGQTKTPTFVFGKFIVADFDIDEFKAALNEAPAIKEQLGL
jgi:glutaredoxin